MALEASRRENGHDLELDEVVALKLRRREVVDQPGMLDRFRQEVKLARRDAIVAVASE
jgi:hypothetical protein